MKERTELQSVSFSLSSLESHLSVDFSVFTFMSLPYVDFIFFLRPSHAASCSRNPC